MFQRVDHTEDLVKLFIEERDELRYVIFKKNFIMYFIKKSACKDVY